MADLLSEVVQVFPTRVRTIIETKRRRINFVLLTADAKLGAAKLSELEIKSIRLGILALEVRKMLVRGDIVAPNGAAATAQLAVLDSMLADVGLLEMMRAHSERREHLATSVEDETRALIGAMVSRRNK